MVSAKHTEGMGGETYKVVTEELHDEGRVLVALLAQGVELCTSWSVFASE